MATVLGLSGKLYYQTDGVDGSAGWVELGNTRDLTITMERGEADVTRRSANGWRQRVGTLAEMTFEFEMVWDPTDAGFSAIRSAFLAATEIGLRALDQDGGEGFQGDFAITNFSKSEPLEEAQIVNVSAVLSALPLAGTPFINP